MIDFDNMRGIVANSLREYVGCLVRRSNQAGDEPRYPYINYTITTLMSENRGTYGVYDDGAERKAATQIWSITSLSDDNTQSVENAVKAREWLDRVGTTYLSDNGVIVQSVGSITNRDNVLTADYEYSNGFDCVFVIYDTVEDTEKYDGTIKTAEMPNITEIK